MKIARVSALALTLTLLLHAPRARAQDVAFGQALFFNGTDQYVRVAQPFIPTNGEFTIECWVNATATNGPFATFFRRRSWPCSPTSTWALI